MARLGEYCNTEGRIADVKKCPRCKTWMTQGSPHAEGDAYQWECHRCGYIERVSREAQEV